MASFQFQHKRGILANAPVLADGEFYFAEDTFELLSGTATHGNVVISGASSYLLVHQVAHGFTSGQAIYFNGTVWVLAKANADGTLGVALVGLIDSDNFYADFMGYVAGLSGFTAGQYYFVSDATPGALTTTEPTNTSSFSNPLFLALSSTTGIVFPFRPNQIASIPSHVQNVSTNYNAVAGDFIFVDTTSGDVQITLPLSVNNVDGVIIIKKISSDSNEVNVVNSGSDTIDGSTPWVIQFPKSAMEVVADGVLAWNIC